MRHRWTNTAGTPIKMNACAQYAHWERPEVADAEDGGLSCGFGRDPAQRTRSVAFGGTSTSSGSLS